MRNWVTLLLYGVMKVNRHASNLSFHTSRDALGRMKGTVQIHDTLLVEQQQQQQQDNKDTFAQCCTTDLNCKRTGQADRDTVCLCEGQWLMFTSPTAPNMAATEVARPVTTF